METSREKLLTTVGFLGANISSSLFQLIILAFLAGSNFFIMYFSAIFIMPFTKNGYVTQNTSEIITYAITAVIYGIVWLVFWRSLFNNGIKWFYWRVLFAEIPLILILLVFDPTPNPMAMLPRPSEPIFSSLVTAIILLPIYSILIYKFILQKDDNNVRNTILVCFVTMIIGTLLRSLILEHTVNPSIPSIIMSRITMSDGVFINSVRRSSPFSKVVTEYPSFFKKLSIIFRILASSSAIYIVLFNLLPLPIIQIIVYNIIYHIK
jgi:hypothetical protein